MRRVVCGCVALVGLALAATSTAWADPPHLCPTCQGQQQAFQQAAYQQPAYQQPAYQQVAYQQPAYPQAGYPQPAYQQPGYQQPAYQQPQAAPAAHHHTWPHRHGYRSVRMCENCMRAQQMANGGAPAGPPMVMASTPGCATCEAKAAAAGAMLPPGYMGGESAPGYAVAGGEADPAPIGVVQAGFRPANEPPGHAVSGAGAAALAGAPPTPVAPPGHRSPHVLMHIFGLRSPGAVWDEHRDRARMAHAAIPYGPSNVQPPAELPARLVYGR